MTVRGPLLGRYIKKNNLSKGREITPDATLKAVPWLVLGSGRAARDLFWASDATVGAEKRRAQTVRSKASEHGSRWAAGDDAEGSVFA